MTLWQWQGMLFEHSRLMKPPGPDPMTDAEYDAGIQRIRDMNLPDVKL